MNAPEPVILLSLAALAAYGLAVLASEPVFRRLFGPVRAYLIRRRRFYARAAALGLSSRDAAFLHRLSLRGALDDPLQVVEGSCAAIAAKCRTPKAAAATFRRLVSIRMELGLAQEARTGVRSTCELEKGQTVVVALLQKPETPVVVCSVAAVTPLGLRLALPNASAHLPGLRAGVWVRASLSIRDDAHYSFEARVLRVERGNQPSATLAHVFSLARIQRRRHVRVRRHMRTHFHMPGAPARLYPAEVVDLSAGGISMILGHDAPEGSEIMVSLAFAGLDTPVRALLLRQESYLASGLPRWRAHLQFLGLSPAQEGRLSRWVFHALGRNVSSLPPKPHPSEQETVSVPGRKSLPLSPAPA